MPRRFLNWQLALSDLKSDRQSRPVVREELLRSIRGFDGVPMSAWRGRTGRRYVVTVSTLSEIRFDEIGDAVVIAVRRPDVGPAEVIDAADAASVDEPATWVDRVEAQGATELHLHRLADTRESRNCAVLDLIPLAPDAFALADVVRDFAGEVA